MSPIDPAKVVAACLGLSGFVIAIVTGVSVGNPASDILVRALLALVICQVVGFAIGWIADQTIQQRLTELRAHSVAAAEKRDGKPSASSPSAVRAAA